MRDFLDTIGGTASFVLGAAIGGTLMYYIGYLRAQFRRSLKDYRDTKRSVKNLLIATINRAKELAIAGAIGAAILGTLFIGIKP